MEAQAPLHVAVERILQISEDLERNPASQKISANVNGLASMDKNSESFRFDEDSEENHEDATGRGSWRAANFVIVHHFFALLAYSGVSRTLVRYLTVVMKQTNASASTIVLNFSGTSYITTLIGAVLGDSFMGHFPSSVLFAVIYVVGQTFVALSSNVSALRPPQCTDDKEVCSTSGSWQLAFLYVSIYLISIGRAGYPAYQVFGANQFDDQTQKEDKSSFFTYMFQSLTFGYMISATAVVSTEENFGWGIGFMLTALASILSLLSLISGLPFYKQKKPKGNSCTKIFQVFVASLYKCRLSLPPSDELYNDRDSENKSNPPVVYSSDFRFLDKAAIETPKLQSERDGRNPWRLCTLAQVEDVKQILRSVPVCVSCIIFTSIYSQLTTLFVIQGGVMYRKVGVLEIPAATMTVFENLSVLLCGCLYNKCFVPMMRKITGHPKGISPLQRIGTGLCIGGAAMMVAAMVERQRLAIASESSSDSDRGETGMTILFLIPQYFLVGLGEIFTYVGLTEFFYDQSPPNLRSVGSSISMLTQAIGNYLSALLVSVVYRLTTNHGEPGWIPDDLNEGHVDKFYLLLAGLCGFSFMYFLTVASRFRHRGDEEDYLNGAAPSQSSLKQRLLS